MLYCCSYLLLSNYYVQCYVLIYSAIAYIHLKHIYTHNIYFYFVTTLAYKLQLTFLINYSFSSSNISYNDYLPILIHMILFVLLLCLFLVLFNYCCKHFFLNFCFSHFSRFYCLNKVSYQYVYSNHTLKRKLLPICCTRRISSLSPTCDTANIAE